MNKHKDVERIIGILVNIELACAYISLICLILAALFNSAIAFWIMVSMIGICITGYIVIMGIMLWDMLNW